MEVNGKFLAVVFDKQNSADKLTLALERIDWV
jgi:hypothetical protein